MWCINSSTWCKHSQTPSLLPLLSSWSPFPLIKSTKLLFSWNWVEQLVRSLLPLDSVTLPSVAFALNTVPTFPKLLVVIHPSFLLLICTMLFNFLVLERLWMLSRSPRPFRMSRTIPSLPRPSTVTWRKLVWRLWWSRNTLFLPSIIGEKGWILLWVIRTGLWMIGSVLYDQMRSKLIALTQMVESGLGKRQERASVIDLWRVQSSLEED